MPSLKTTPNGGKRYFQDKIVIKKNTLATCKYIFGQAKTPGVLGKPLFIRWPYDMVRVKTPCGWVISIFGRVELLRRRRISVITMGQYIFGRRETLRVREKMYISRVKK
jgi:hypothetical protein